MIELIQGIYPYIIAILPALASILSVIGAVLKFAKANKEAVKPLIEEIDKLKSEIEDNKEYKILKEKMTAIISQNAQLRKELDELITVMGKVQHDSEI